MTHIFISRMGEVFACMRYAPGNEGVNRMRLITAVADEYDVLTGSVDILGTIDWERIKTDYEYVDILIANEDDYETLSLPEQYTQDTIELKIAKIY